MVVTFYSMHCVYSLYACDYVFSNKLKIYLKILVVPPRDGRYQNFDVDAISIYKASIYQYIAIFITVWSFSLNLCKCIKYIAFCFKLLRFGDLNLPLLLKTATLWTLLLPWLTSNHKINLFAIYIFQLFKRYFFKSKNNK